MFCCLTASLTGALLRVADTEFGEHVVLQAIVPCPEPEYGYLLTTGQQIVWVCTVVVWMLVFPLGLLFGLDDGLGFRVASKPVRVILCCALFHQGVCSLVAPYITVGRNPLQGDCVTSA